MHERAAEIGWQLRVSSIPGEGTCILVCKPTPGKEQECDGA
jgi:signal transduction histidine kinase